MGVLAEHVGEALASALQVVVDGSPGWGCGLPVGQFRRADGSDGQVDAFGAGFVGVAFADLPVDDAAVVGDHSLAVSAGVSAVGGLERVADGALEFVEVASS